MDSEKFGQFILKLRKKKDGRSLNWLKNSI